MAGKNLSCAVRRYHRVSVSTGTVAQPAAIRGVFEPLRTNYFCGSCRSFVQAPLGASAMRACPTPGCKRPTGFGVFAKVARPRSAVRTPAP
jgi:LSD1 subclass zinc finger protein